MQIAVLELKGSQRRWGIEAAENVRIIGEALLFDEELSGWLLALIYISAAVNSWP